MSKICLELFGTFAVFNVGRRTTPFHDLSSLVPQRHGADQEPAILSVDAAQARFIIQRFATRKAAPTVVRCG